MDFPLHSLWPLVRRHARSEVGRFLAVGGTGYVADVVAFNILLSTAPFDHWDPSLSRIAAMAVAMVVTYCGNRWITWRGASEQSRTREVVLFVVFNLVGLGISTATLVFSHDVLGLTGRLADNVSANVVGLGLGTLFRFWSYRRYVFSAPATPDSAPVSVGAGPTR